MGPDGSAAAEVRPMATAASMRWGLQAAVLLAAFTLARGDASADEASPPHERLSLTSATLHEVRRINVYLPPSYDADPSTRYPVRTS